MIQKLSFLYYFTVKGLKFKELKKMNIDCEITYSIDEYKNKIEIKTIGNRKYVTGLHTNGNKMYIEEYKDGKEEGKWIRWDEDGTKEYEGEYKDGKKEGKWTWWWEDGNKQREVEYKDGKEEGKCIGWWYISGNKKYEGEYKDGKREGKWIGWWDNGNKMYEREYKDGNLIP